MEFPVFFILLIALIKSRFSDKNLKISVKMAPEYVTKASRRHMQDNCRRIIHDQNGFASQNIVYIVVD